jgi:hypothetical protein
MGADRTQWRAKPDGGGAGSFEGVVYPRFDRGRSDDVNQAFNNWLDAKLRAMYRATQSEPLPQELLDLVQRLRHSS